MKRFAALLLCALMLSTCFAYAVSAFTANIYKEDGTLIQTLTFEKGYKLSFIDRPDELMVLGDTRTPGNFMQKNTLLFLHNGQVNILYLAGHTMFRKSDQIETHRYDSLMWTGWKGSIYP